MLSQSVLGCVLLVLVVAYGSVINSDVQKTGKLSGRKTIRQSRPEQVVQKAVGVNVHRTPESEDGSPCSFNFECKSGCCLVGFDHHRRCSAKATFQQLCTIGQIKGGAYDGFCPCQMGDSVCIQSNTAGDYHCNA